MLVSKPFTAVSIIQILSLDVVLGACISAVFVAKFLVVPIPRLSLVALAICVWLIYTADHLLDAYRLQKRVAHTARHRYHQIHFKAIGIAWVIVALIGLGVMFSLPLRLLYYGAILLGGVFVYFLFARYSSLTQWFPKEFLTALLYTAGVFLPSLAYYEAPLYWSVGVLFFQYLFLALSNLLLFSWFEVDTDRQDDHSSLALTIGRPLTYKGILLLLAVVIIMAIFMLLVVSISSVSMVAQATILVMALVLLWIIVRPAYFQQREHYRLLGDGIFLLPAIPLLWL